MSAPLSPDTFVSDPAASPPSSTRNGDTLVAPGSISGEAFQTLASALISRTALAGRLGRSYWTTTGAKRDLYEALGWPTVLYFEDFAGRFRRQGVAKRVVSAPARASWVRPPILTDGRPSSRFTRAWERLEQKHRITHYMTRADVVSGIGRYGILLLGLPGRLETPVSEADDLLYLTPLSEGSAKVVSWETNTSNPRFGKPVAYEVTLTVGDTSLPAGDNSTSASHRVHYSRVIHIADNLTESDVFGSPRLEPVWNDLYSLEMVTGGSAEMFWRGAFPGLSLSVDPETRLDPNLDLETEIQNYLHGLQRYLRTQGIDVKELSPQAVSPRDHVDALYQAVSGATGIPKRVLTGTERGELASRLDEKNWIRLLNERRTEHNEPQIIRPTADRFIELGILPPPQGGAYTVEHLPIEGPADKDAALVADIRSRALAKYVESGSNSVMGFSAYLRVIMGLDAETTAMVLASVDPADVPDPIIEPVEPDPDAVVREDP